MSQKSLVTGDESAAGAIVAKLDKFTSLPQNGTEVTVSTVVLPNGETCPTGFENLPSGLSG